MVSGVDLQSLLAQILEVRNSTPLGERLADDGLRLIYADALEESGDGDRAEFIRCQIALANMVGVDVCACIPQRQRFPSAKAQKKVYLCQPCTLLQCEWGLLRGLHESGKFNVCEWMNGWMVSGAMWAEHGSQPFDDLRHRLTHQAVDYRVGGTKEQYYTDAEVVVAQFNRGFVDEVTLSSAAWLAHCDELCAAQPVRVVWLTTLPVDRDFQLWPRDQWFLSKMVCPDGVDSEAIAALGSGARLSWFRSFWDTPLKMHSTRWPGIEFKVAW